MSLRAVLPWLLLSQLACLATIPPLPPRRVSTPAVLPELPVLEPCVLLSFRRTQALSDVMAGGPGSAWELAAATILVPHVSGPLLLEPAIGRDTVKDMEGAPFWFRQAFGDWSTARPLVALLEEVDIPAESIQQVLATHVHWDHVGALRDLPNARALLWEPELQFLRTRSGYVDKAVMPHQLAPVQSRLIPFRMDGPSYEGFAASHDVLGDGSVVAVPLPGHTPGSTAFFVNSGDGRRWLFTGDTTWSAEGIHRPAHKPWLASVVTDHDDRALAESIALLHAFARARPDITLVPSHDLSALTRLPVCRKRERP